MLLQWSNRRGIVQHRQQGPLRGSSLPLKPLSRRRLNPIKLARPTSAWWPVQFNNQRLQSSRLSVVGPVGSPGLLLRRIHRVFRTTVVNEANDIFVQPLQFPKELRLPPRSRRLITLIWSHTRQFVISFITSVTIHYSFSLSLQAQNLSFPQILSSIDLSTHRTDSMDSSCFFVFFLGHVGFHCMLG